MRLARPTETTPQTPHPSTRSGRHAGVPTTTIEALHQLVRTADQAAAAASPLPAAKPRKKKSLSSSQAATSPG